MPQWFSSVKDFDAKKITEMSDEDKEKFYNGTNKNFTDAISADNITNLGMLGQNVDQNAPGDPFKDMIDIVLGCPAQGVLFGLSVAASLIPYVLFE